MQRRDTADVPAVSDPGRRQRCYSHKSDGDCRECGVHSRWNRCDRFDQDIGISAATATATLANSAATVNMTVPSGFSYIQASTGTFTLNAELRRALPPFGGEKILQAAVEFDGSRERAYFFTESGRRVSGEELFAGQ